MKGHYSIKWTMNSSTHFTSTVDGNNLIVSKGGLGWIWQIVKDGLIVDCAMYHPHAPTSELDAKVKCERALLNINHPSPPLYPLLDQ